MSHRLRILAGTSLENLVPITELVNTPRTFELSSDVFKGEVVVCIKGMTEEDGTPRNSEYFEREDRSGITWSIQIQGKNPLLVSYDKRIADEMIELSYLSSDCSATKSSTFGRILP